MSVATFDSIKGHNVRNIRKALAGALFVKRFEEGDAPITRVWSESEGLIIPADYVSVGVTAKGSPPQFGRDMQTSDVESWGHAEPTRSDVSRDVDTLQFTAQESKLVVFELYRGADYSSVTPDVDGNIILDKPSTPSTDFWRAFTLSKDGDGADAVYWLDWLPRCSVTAVENQTLSEDTELQFSVTLTGYQDPAVSTSRRTIWGGPGLDPEAMGFAQ